MDFRRFFVSWVACLLLGTTIHAQQPSRGLPSPAAAQRQPAPPTPQEPWWVAQMSPAHRKHVDDILTYWEFRSDKITRYQCRFQRWEYDPVFGPSDTFKTYSRGEIKFESPDKGLFMVSSTQQYQPPQNNGEAPKWVESTQAGEHWVCDGSTVFEFDVRRKRLVERPLPPEMHGKAITSGPLPFLFGAKAADIKSRFWLRVVTPQNVKDEYHLEAVPKTLADVDSFKAIHIVIDQKEYLPRALIVFERNVAGGKTTYQFDDRNENFTLDQLKIWERSFWAPAVPKGWTKVRIDYNADTAQAQRPAGNRTNQSRAPIR